MKRPRCFIAIVNGSKRGAIQGLLRYERVLRVTDHGSHIKIVVRGALPKVCGVHAMAVRDRTTHWDVRYWDFATEIARHTWTKGQEPHRSIAVLLHYLANIFVLPEAELLDMIAANRRFVGAAVTEEEAHGWELPYLQKLYKTRKAK